MGISWKGEVLREPVYLADGQESKYLTDFTEIAFIGRGGFGIVAKCKNNYDKKEYAIKKISLNYVDMSLDKLLREVEAMSSMKHPNVVQYYQAWIESQMSGCVSGKTDSKVLSDEDIDGLSQEDIQSPCLYILMELCSSCLADYLVDLSFQVGEREALEFFTPILRGLEHIHSKGFIHGDMSLSNVFVDSDNNIKIGDFGLARKLEDGGFVKFSNSDGIRLYKAPEKVRGSRVDLKIDMYSLGIIFLEILHHFPTAYEKQKFIDDMKNGVVGEGLVDVYTPMIQRLISNDPKERPDVAQVMAEFENLVFDIP